MTDLTEMWTALEQYQPYADEDGHGESWKRMTTERTGLAAASAGTVAWGASMAWAAVRRAVDASPATGGNAAAAWLAARLAMWAMESSEGAVEKGQYATHAVECINKAMKVTP